MKTNFNLFAFTAFLVIISNFLCSCSNEQRSPPFDRAKANKEQAIENRKMDSLVKIGKFTGTMILTPVEQPFKNGTIGSLIIGINALYIDSITKYQDLQGYYNKFGTPTQQVQNRVMLDHWVEKAETLERQQAKQQAKKELEIKYKIKL